MLARHVEDRESAKQYLSFPFTPSSHPSLSPPPLVSIRAVPVFRVLFSNRSSGDVLVTDCARSGLWIYLDKWRLDIGVATYLWHEDRVALNYKRVYGGGGKGEEL